MNITVELIFRFEELNTGEMKLKTKGIEIAIVAAHPSLIGFLQVSTTFQILLQLNNGGIWGTRWYCSVRECSLAFFLLVSFLVLA